MTNQLIKNLLSDKILEARVKNLADVADSNVVPGADLIKLKHQELIMDVAEIRTSAGLSSKEEILNKISVFNNSFIKGDQLADRFLSKIKSNNSPIEGPVPQDIGSSISGDPFFRNKLTELYSNISKSIPKDVTPDYQALLDLSPGYSDFKNILSILKEEGAPMLQESNAVHQVKWLGDFGDKSLNEIISSVLDVLATSESGQVGLQIDPTKVYLYSGVLVSGFFIYKGLVKLFNQTVYFDLKGLTPEQKAAELRHLLNLKLAFMFLGAPLLTASLYTRHKKSIHHLLQSNSNSTLNSNSNSLLNSDSPGSQIMYESLEDSTGSAGLSSLLFISKLKNKISKWKGYIVTVFSIGIILKLFKINIINIVLLIINDKVIISWFVLGILFILFILILFLILNLVLLILFCKNQIKMPISIGSITLNWQWMRDLEVLSTVTAPLPLRDRYKVLLILQILLYVFIFYLVYTLYY